MIEIRRKKNLENIQQTQSFVLWSRVICQRPRSLAVDRVGWARNLLLGNAALQDLEPSHTNKQKLWTWNAHSAEYIVKKHSSIAKTLNNSIFGLFFFTFWAAIYIQAHLTGFSPESGFVSLFAYLSSVSNIIKQKHS